MGDPPLPNLESTWTSDGAPVGRPEPVFVPESCRGAFGMLVAAGVDPKEAVGWALGGIEPAQARLQLARLLEAPTRLEAFGPRSLAIALLVRAAAGGLNGQEVRARVGDFRGLRIVRPDGVIADAVTGRGLERAGEVRSDGEGWRAGTLEVGELYRDEGGVLYAVDDHLAADRSRGPMFERSLDRMVLGRALDGAEQAFVSMAMGLGELIRDPATAVEGLVQALGSVGAVLTAAPELVDQFLAMPPGDRVEAVSQLMVSVLLARSAGKASGALIDAGGAGAGLTMQVHGSVGGLAFALDLRGALIGTAGVALAPMVIVGPADVLSRSEAGRGAPKNEDVVGRRPNNSSGPGRVDGEGLLGARGPQISSRTLWKGPNGMRIDVENPNPGQRPGQLHFQQGTAKYLYDPIARAFVGAPRAINDLLALPEVQRAIAKGLRFLGEP